MKTASPIPNPLPQNTRLGLVHLKVSNLSTSLNFYQRSLGLQVHRQAGKAAYLGSGQKDFLVLTEIRDATLPHRNSGLYHFAVLVPTRLALGQFLQNLVNTQTQVQGMVDHIVSEAIYLPDPDGNGIEFYRDKPKEQWQYEPNGDIRMANLPLDVDGVMAELDKGDPWEKMAGGTVLGHMHLHISQIANGINFYKDIIGLDLMMEWGRTAAFMSSGGYHHHLGINTWNGVGATPPPLNSVGLDHFTVELPNFSDLEIVLSRAEKANLVTKKRDDGYLIKDPSQNGVLLKSPE